MEKSVTVIHKLYDGIEEFSIPVSYEVKNEGNRTAYKCKVALTEGEIPDWLTVTEFEIPIIYTPGNPGVTVTAFGEVKGIKTIDTAMFIVEVEQQISITIKNARGSA
jgi:hypothetical protein